MRNNGCMYVRTTLQLAKLFENLYCSYYSLHLISMFLNKTLCLIFCQEVRGGALGKFERLAFTLLGFHWIIEKN